MFASTVSRVRRTKKNPFQTAEWVVLLPKLLGHLEGIGQGSLAARKVPGEA